MGVNIVAILAIGICFRIWKLDTIPGVNGDEAWLGWKAFQVAHGARLDWMTFSGNLTDPFYILPLIALHKIFAPSTTLLRGVAVISGVLVLPMNYYLCRWVFDRKTAWGTTLLLAVLPVNIVYSRFGWEPSQSVLFALPPLYLALALGGGLIKPVFGCVCFGISLLAALMVHPTNFFLAGFGLSAIAAMLLRPESGAKRLAAYAGATVLGFILLGLIAILKAPVGVHDEIVARVTSLGWMHDADRFLLVWGRFFNGLNSLCFIPGSWQHAATVLNDKLALWTSWPDWLTLVFFFLAIIAILAGVGRSLRWPDPSILTTSGVRVDLILLVGFLEASILFDILNGPYKCSVWFDRYGLWVVPSGILILVRGAVRLQEMIPRFGPLVRFCGVALCFLLLFQTWCGYFVFALKTGGNSGMDAHVGKEDIKLSAAKMLARYGNEPTVLCLDRLVCVLADPLCPA